MPLSEIVQNSNFIITLLVFLAASSAIGWVIWRDKKPRESLSPGLVPTLPVMMFSGIVALLALVHLVNLLGIHTGR
jgi:amino acid transporter